MGHAWDVKYLTTVSILVGSVVIIITLPETNIAPAKRKLHLPTINFQGRAVSFREGIIIIICGLDQSNIPAHDTPSPLSLASMSNGKQQARCERGSNSKVSHAGYTKGNWKQQRYFPPSSQTTSKNKGLMKPYEG